MEGQAQEAKHEWQKAASTYGMLFQMYPDSLEYGLQLASVQASAGSFRDSLATLDSLRKLPTPERDDARIDLLAANAFDQMGDHKQQQSAALSAE